MMSLLSMWCPKSLVAVLPNETELSINSLESEGVCMGAGFFFLFQMMVYGVNSVPTNPYAAVSQLSGLAEVIIGTGEKASTHQATIGDD